MSSERQFDSRNESFIMRDYVGTFFRSMSLKHRYSIFAVVRQYEDHLTAWEIEMRGNNIYHPAYGLIPKTDIDEIDLFIDNKDRKVPSFSFNANERGFVFIGDDIQKIIWLPT